MLAPDELLDSSLSDLGMDISSSTGYLTEGPSGPFSPYKEEGYTGETDYRIRQLSYSSLLTLHSCPRKFQLDKLRAQGTSETLKSTITFSYGHVVGEGIALALANVPFREILWKLFLSWHTPSLFDSDDALNKSFFGAIIAVQKFMHLRETVLADYELVYHDGKPATELSFSIALPNGFRLRGFVDAVLRNKITGAVVVLECKTTGIAAVEPAQYKNSSQAIGYSIVLDHLFPELSSYEVLYLVYATKATEYHLLPFPKTYLQRAIWIRELLLDVDVIQMYEAAGIYPMRGESCYSFRRECKYFNTCSLSTDALAKPMTADMVDKTDYQVQITLADLLETQLRKVSA